MTSPWGPGGTDPHSGHGGGHDPSDPYRRRDSHAPGSTPPPPPGNPHPYGAPYSYGPPPLGHDRPLDGVSVAALVTAVLCCTAPAAIVLGIVGLVRTKDGRRSGRWMAVVGLVGGIVVSLLLAGLVAVGVWYGQHTVTPGNAEAGQCVNIREDGDTVMMFTTDCTAPHDGEIVHVGIYDAAADAGHHGPEGRLNAAICLEHLSNAALAALERAQLRPDDLMVIAEDPDAMTDGDPYTCYVDPGHELTEPVLGGSDIRRS